MSAILTMGMYKPTEGNEQELMEVLKTHIPTLQEYGLITDKGFFRAQSEDGTIMEIFEWASAEAIDAAHKHPAIMQIWGQMMPICTFPTLKDLPEQKSFPNFTVLS